MTREQLMSKPATLSKLMVIGLLGALSLLLLEIRFEHREALGEAWQSWIPLLYCGAMLALGAAALTRWHRGGRQVLLVGVSAICDSEGDWQSSASSAPGLEPRIFRGPDARAGRRYPQSSSWNHEDPHPFGNPATSHCARGDGCGPGRCRGGAVWAPVCRGPSATVAHRGGAPDGDRQRHPGAEAGRHAKRIRGGARKLPNPAGSVERSSHVLRLAFTAERKDLSSLDPTRGQVDFARPGRAGRKRTRAHRLRRTRASRSASRAPAHFGTRRRQRIANRPSADLLARALIRNHLEVHRTARVRRTPARLIACS